MSGYRASGQTRLRCDLCGGEPGVSPTYAHDGALTCAVCADAQVLAGAEHALHASREARDEAQRLERGAAAAWAPGAPLLPGPPARASMLFTLVLGVLALLAVLFVLVVAAFLLQVSLGSRGPD